MQEFEWDKIKNERNIAKHGVSFFKAQLAFADPHRIIAVDERHSGKERRYHCFGRIDEGVITVNFTIRKEKIRIIGAGYWRKGRKAYEKENG